MSETPTGDDGETPTADDYESIERAADELQRRGWAKRYSLNEAIDEWSSFVDMVEIGYTMTIDNYTNDVSVRQWLDEARPFLTPGIVRSMDARMGGIDVRFLAATEPISRHLSDSLTGWWGHRVPEVLVDGLAEDVTRLHLRDRDSELPIRHRSDDGRSNLAQRVVLAYAIAAALAVTARTVSNILVDGTAVGWFMYEPNANTLMTRIDSDGDSLRVAAVWLVAIALWLGVSWRLFRPKRK